MVEQLDWNLYDITKAREIAKRYGSLMVGEMARKIQELDLVQRGELLRSIKASVRTTFSEVDRIEFSYAWYGLIFENGAQNVFGKGVTIDPMHWRNESMEAYKPDMDAEFTLLYAQMIINQIQIADASLEM